eukprot:325936-Pelagomonas_calceolata.AAC.1
MLLPTSGSARNSCFPATPGLQARSLQIIAAWNTAARIRLNGNDPTWLTKLAKNVPEARRWKTTIRNDQILNARHPDIET